MPTISTSDGVQLHYTDDGDGRPVVLIAGFSAPAESWEFQRRALLAEGHRVLALDRRSHGRSQSPQYGQRMARHATASAASNPRATAIVFEDCGHAANIDQPEQTNAAILEFLND
jgi:pimeloyl-ACP methyl ester carboxylesterase